MSLANLPETYSRWTLARAPTDTHPKAHKLVFTTTPSPTSFPTPTSVLLKIHAVALAARDLQIVEGHYPAPHDILENCVPTGSSAAEVVAVGPAVKNWKVGDHVTPMSMPGHYDTLDLPQSSLARSLGGATHGCAQEYMFVDAEDMLSVPSHLSWEEVAGLGSATTAWCCLFGHTPQLLPGSTVLVLGTGGVSMFAAQFALASGSNIILTSSSDEKLERVTKFLQPLLNPTHGPKAIQTINYKKDTEWDKTVREMTDGRGADHVAEVAGWATVGKCVKALRKGGLVAVTGYLSAYEKVPEEIIQQGESIRALIRCVRSPRIDETDLQIFPRSSSTARSTSEESLSATVPRLSK